MNGRALVPALIIFIAMLGCTQSESTGMAVFTESTGQTFIPGEMTGKTAYLEKNVPFGISGTAKITGNSMIDLVNFSFSDEREEIIIALTLEGAPVYTLRNLKGEKHQKSHIIFNVTKAVEFDSIQVICVSCNSLVLSSGKFE